MENICVLLVDDDPHFREPMRDWLKNMGFKVSEAANCEEALQTVVELNGSCDIALIDQVLGKGPDGIETMKEIHKQFPDLQTIIFTGWGDQKSGVRALQEGAYRYLLKPVDPEEVNILIHSVLEYRRVQRRLELTKREKEWLSTLLRVTQTMQRQMGDRKSILITIAEAAAILTSADECAICINDPIKNQFTLTPSNGKELFTRSFRKAIRKIGRKAMDNGRPQHITDANHHDDISPEILEAGIRSVLAMPIEKDGVLYAFDRKPNYFGEEATNLLEMLASEAMIVIKNANLLEEREQRVKELEKLREVYLAL
jgi:DNA-binding response OmpR family regulator